MEHQDELEQIMEIVKQSFDVQTEFDIMGGISALSKGYEKNEVLNKLQEDSGVTINWNVMSDSLSEQVC